MTTPTGWRRTVPGRCSVGIEAGHPQKRALPLVIELIDALEIKLLVEFEIELLNDFLEGTHD